MDSHGSGCSVTFRRVNELLVAISCNHSWRGFICVKHALNDKQLSAVKYLLIFTEINCTEYIVCVYCDKPKMGFMLKDLKFSFSFHVALIVFVYHFTN